MFVESELTWTIAISPCHLKSGLHIQRGVLRKLLADFDKLKCSENHGYYICVTTLEEIGEGKIWEGKGCIAYKVRFRCVTYKPQIYEIGFAVVTGESQEKGVLCAFGPMDNVFLAFKYMKDRYTFEASEGKPSHFRSKEDGSVIEMGTVLRVQIVGVKYNSSSRTYDTVCSVKGPYLGVEKRIFEDKSAPQAPSGADAEWGTKLDADGNGAEWGTKTGAAESEAGGWGGGGWGAPAPEGSGGWDAGAAEENKRDEAWDAAPAKSHGDSDDIPGKKADSGGGWDASPPKRAGSGCGWVSDTATEITEAWDSAPSRKTDSDRRKDTAAEAESTWGWGAASAEKNSGGGWDDQPSGVKSDVNTDRVTSTDPEKEETDGWGSSPAKKTKVGVWGSSATEKKGSDSGAWDTVEVENSGGGWGV